MKKIGSIGVILGLGLVLLVACKSGSATSDQHKEQLVIAPEKELIITPTKDGVEVFLAKNKAFTSGYEKDTCYNITPEFVKENATYTIFKYDSSTASFLLYDGEVYQLGEYFGGSGIEGIALADLNQDTQYELYFTYSWGSGIHHAQVGYFDPVSKTVKTLEYMETDKDMMLTTSDGKTLCIADATIKGDSFVNYTVTAEKTIGTIQVESDGNRKVIKDSK